MRIGFKQYDFTYETQDTILHYFLDKYSSKDYRIIGHEEFINALLDLVDKFDPPEDSSPRTIDVPELMHKYMEICFYLESKEHDIDIYSRPDDLLPILENNITIYLEK